MLFLSAATLQQTFSGLMGVGLPPGHGVSFVFVGQSVSLVVV
jgi:hypothetical protein